jgi:[acyl-carrier-protein] S-malonyltransferase
MRAFLFPGQGAQTPAMGAPWQGTSWWSVVEEASDATGRDVGRLLLEADATTLTATENAQLACLTLSLVVLAAAAEAGHQPDVTAGHSLGEYTALVGAGILDVAGAARLVDARGAAMAGAIAAQPGSMAAVLGLDAEAVYAACEGVEGAWVANDNAPGQIVIAGTPAGLEAAAANAKTAGGKVKALAVAGAFHTPLMAPAQAPLDAALAAASFQSGAVAVVANVDGVEHAGGEDWGRLLSAQLCSPVRWRPGLGRLVELGVTTFVELGPGAALTGMVKRTVPDARRFTVNAPADLAALGG